MARQQSMHVPLDTLYRKKKRLYECSRDCLHPLVIGDQPLKQRPCKFKVDEYSLNLSKKGVEGVHFVDNVRVNNNSTDASTSTVFDVAKSICTTKQRDHNSKDFQVSDKLSVPIERKRAQHKESALEEEEHNIMKANRILSSQIFHIEWRLSIINEDTMSSEELQKLELISGINPQSSDSSAQRQNIDNKCYEEVSFSCEKLSKLQLMSDINPRSSNYSNNVAIQLEPTTQYIDDKYCEEDLLSGEKLQKLPLISDIDSQSLSSSNHVAFQLEPTRQKPEDKDYDSIALKPNDQLPGPFPHKIRNERPRILSSGCVPLLVPKTSQKLFKPDASSRRATRRKITGERRQCLHCATDNTPQWRRGPLGPKTLCNACGVRYKSGRLVPEYRPAASPTFVEQRHSNSHRKVMELRKQRKLEDANYAQHVQLQLYQQELEEVTKLNLHEQHQGMDFNVTSCEDFRWNHQFMIANFDESLIKSLS